MVKFFYKLFRLEYEEPLCGICEVLKEQIAELQIELTGLKNKNCEVCEILKTQLEIERFEKRELLNKTIFKSEPIQQQQEEREFKPVMPRHTPWSIRQGMLEREDREKARILAEYEKINKESNPVIKVEELEKELLTEDNEEKEVNNG